MQPHQWATASSRLPRPRAACSQQAWVSSTASSTEFYPYGDYDCQHFQCTLDPFMTSYSSYLPDDLDGALLVGRVWRQTKNGAGPCVVAVRGGGRVEIPLTSPTRTGPFTAHAIPQSPPPESRRCTARRRDAHP